MTIIYTIEFSVLLFVFYTFVLYFTYILLYAQRSIQVNKTKYYQNIYFLHMKI